jgi:hypothetical protein
MWKRKKDTWGRLATAVDGLLKPQKVAYEHFHDIQDFQQIGSRVVLFFSNIWAESHKKIKTS